MKKIFAITILSVFLGLAGCKKDSEFLNVQAFGILSADQVFSDNNQVISYLGDLYNRQVDITAFKYGWESFADFSEAVPATTGSALVNRNGWDFSTWGLWDYGYVRDLNLFIERAGEAKTLAEGDRNRFVSEARFLRANHYFELVKRMGGVPLITKSLLYDFSGDPTYLQQPRAKESEIYDFIISEAEAIKGLLPSDIREKSRATRGAVLAMEARAALYAASIAKYGVNTPSVSLPGGEIGIPASMAAGYYAKALKAAEEVITGTAGRYALYTKFQSDLGQNFANLFIDNTDKAGNPETIFFEDYKIRSGKTHGFTTNNQPRFGAEEEEGGRLNPSLNLVQEYELLDNTFAPLPIQDAGGNPIYYNSPLELFANRDPRLSGTVMLPSAFGRNRNTDIFAGYQLADGSVITGAERGALGTLPGISGQVQVVGLDGPLNSRDFVAQSGFYLRKFIDPAPGGGSRGTGSEVPWVRYRYAEVLLNAAEAAFELGQPGVAAGYMSQVRARAGFTVPLTGGQITFDRVVHERRVELAFEGHYLYDRKRWRIAHVVMDGTSMSVTDLLNNIGVANRKNTQPFGLWPYKIHDPGGANHNKWIFKIVKPSIVTGSNRFQLGNYYSFIDDNIRANNPKISRQPNQ
ncbi:MAG: RagB/SusD family nutrient uptake outer membrane protein [Chitinophagaceae bacterium]